MSDEEFEGGGGGSRAGGCLMQIVTHGVALVLGAVIGVLGAQAVEYMRDPDTLARPEGSMSRAELIRKLDDAEQKYAALLAENAKQDEAQRSELESASAKVADLEGQVGKKGDEVKVLELKVKKAKGQSAALKKELEAKQAELTELQVQLTEAQAEQERLREDLTISKEETRSAREETRVSKGETVDAQWVGFKAEVVLSVCEKGNRKRMETCREEVGASLSSTRAARFKQCVGSRQAQPRLVRVDDKEKNPELPRWSEWLNEESKFTEKKWYVVFCDPTLPESNMQEPEDEEL
ncbi:hypothetical protein LBMAG42_40030 [Deltaproteobacteria bacterium]|nr:hypothetical protein LBMAG42_40030 [Deltaproteobacteria bacterium]